jgi:hypothetical protein
MRNGYAFINNLPRTQVKLAGSKTNEAPTATVG